MAAAGVQQALVEQAVLQVAKKLEAQIDDQLHKLDNLQDDDLEKVRQRRIDELKRAQKKTAEWLARGHGEYADLMDEKAFFKEMKGEERMVCHFYRNNWPCKVMDKHLGILAKRHLETKFVRIDAEKSPYLTEKLRVWMLPTLAVVKGEKVADYVVGFDDMGGADDFETEQLEERLAAVDALRLDSGRVGARGGGGGSGGGNAPAQQQTLRTGIYSTTQRGASDEDSDFD